MLENLALNWAVDTQVVNSLLQNTRLFTVRVGGTYRSISHCGSKGLTCY
jgi:hypothetical protein